MQEDVAKSEKNDSEQTKKPSPEEHKLEDKDSQESERATKEKKEPAKVDKGTQQIVEPRQEKSEKERDA